MRFILSTENRKNAIYRCHGLMCYEFRYDARRNPLIFAGLATNTQILILIGSKFKNIHVHREKRCAVLDPERVLY